MDPESINSVFALFDCFGAILYELLIAGLMVPVYQSGAYEALPWVLLNRGKGHLFQGNRGKMPNFEGNKDNFLEQEFCIRKRHHKVPPITKQEQTSKHGSLISAHRNPNHLPKQPAPTRTKMPTENEIPNAHKN